IGNPSLLPEYRNSLSLTYVYKYKYSLTAVAMISQNTALQILKQDEDNPAMTYITSENIDRQASYILSAYLPFTVTKWWNLSTNLTYLYRQERLYADTDSYNQNLYIGYLQSNFTLPRKFNLNMSYYAMSDAKSGNVTIAANHKLSASLSKRLFGDKLSASLKASIPFNDGVYLSTSTDEIEQRMLLKSSWTSPNFGFSLSYNFKAGKEYQSRQAIESSSAEDRARMENNKSN
ncbi:MAG: outer membrane beta-barrel protein, partial [Rikenellaceae bacterium]